MHKRGFAREIIAISQTAIHWSPERFLRSRVRNSVQDLFRMPAEWDRIFDFVPEINTLQSLFPAGPYSLVEDITRTVAPWGHLLSSSRGRGRTGDSGVMLHHAACDFIDCEDPPVRHLRALFGRLCE
jgi:hypothetical protein